MRKHILPSLLILLLAGGFALAQTITRAIQLSQDTTGAFSVDSNNNVYWPGHILSTGPGTPAVSSGGTTPTIIGTDTGGTITMNVAATTVTATFSKAYVSTPWCTITNQGTVTTTMAYTLSTTAIAITMSGAAGANNIVNYHCDGKS